MIHHCILFIILFLSFHVSYTQSNHSIYGYATDSISGEALINAHIVINEKKSGTSTNRYGFFTMSIPEGNYTLSVSMIGYIRKELKLSVNKDIRINVNLKPFSYQLKEVIVNDKTSSLSISSSDNYYKINPKKILDFPVLFGEPDILKSLHSIPGIQQGNEGSAGLHIRGGSPDHNLILIDGIPVYNVFHLFGYLSVFNTDALKDIKIYKDGIPPCYEGRLSSVIDISLKEGNLKQDRTILSISPVASSITYETPIKKNRSSFIVSARRTWLDAVLSLINISGNSKANFSFYDLSAKYYHKLNKDNNIHLSYYTSKDKYFYKFNAGTEKASFNFNWQNHSALLRWNKIINKKLYFINYLSFSNYAFNQIDAYDEEKKKYNKKITSSINDVNLSSKLEYYFSTIHNITFGINLNYQKFIPESEYTFNDNQRTTNFSNTDIKRITGNIFLYDEIYINPGFKLKGGLRISRYNSDKQNFYFQPRASLQYNIGENLTIRTSYDRIAQSLHLLTNTSLGQPTDLWVPTSNDAPSETTNQYSLNIIKGWPRSDISLDLGIYIKFYDNLIEYKEGVNSLFGINDHWEDKITVGKGNSKGLEVLLNKESGKLNGWISYNLSKSMREFNEISNGNPFPYKYDRRHNFSLTSFYELNKNHKFSLLFTYNSGHAITLPIGNIKAIPPYGAEYLYNEKLVISNIEYINSRNNQRMPDYHRLDLSYHNRKKKKNHIRTWIFSIYNVYNRLNPYFLYQSEGKIKQVAMFPVIPSISYRVEFKNFINPRNLE